MTSATNTSEYSKRWQVITNIWQKEQWLYGFVGAMAGFIFGIAVSGKLGQLVNWFADGFWNEALSIAITVIVLDRLNRLRAVEQLKLRLVREAGSQSNETAKSAIDWMRHEGWLTEETALLKNADLSHANLKGARFPDEFTDLEGANISFADLSNTNLDHANLSNTDGLLCKFSVATLSSADFRNADLEKADFSPALLWAAKFDNAFLLRANFARADLANASFCGADLTNANFIFAKFSTTTYDGTLYETKFDEETILPNGETWIHGTDMVRFTDPSHLQFWHPPEEEKLVI